MPEFTRFTETITKKQAKRVVNITVKPTITDCTGSVWFTDLMLQEGDKVTGFVINTEKLLEKYDGDDAKAGKRFYNGIVRSAATCIIYNLGSTAAGLDYKVYPIQAMAAGSISLALGEGAHKATFKAAAAAGDEFDLFASTRECLKNGAATAKLQDFISGQEADITEFDEALVKKLIEKITVFNDHFTVEFKSGITIDIEA